MQHETVVVQVLCTITSCGCCLPYGYGRPLLLHSVLRTPHIRTSVHASRLLSEQAAATLALTTEAVPADESEGGPESSNDRSTGPQRSIGQRHRACSQPHREDSCDY